MSREQALNQVCLSKTETFSIKSAPHSIPQDWIGFSASPQQKKLFIVLTRKITQVQHYSFICIAPNITAFEEARSFKILLY